MLTATQLQSIMPRLSPARNGELLPFLQAAMTEFAIETPARAAAFLAQLAHESGQFKHMEEIWGPTPAQQRYEPVSKLATTLGNTEPGDGRRFKGRGPIQVTGRANYRRFGDLLKVDLVSAPERAAVPDLAFRIAGLFWSKKGLNELADQVTDESFREITRRINGGFNGLDERQKFYETACTVLAVEPPAADFGVPTVTRGARNSPASSDEPEFFRGFESIVTDVPEPRRKAAPRKPPARPRRAAASTRKAKPGARATAGTAKTRPRTKTRKAAAGGNRSASRSRTTSSRRVKRVAPKSSRKKR